MWGRIVKTTKNAIMSGFRDYLKFYDEIQFKEIKWLEEFPTDKEEDSRSGWVQIIDKYPKIDQHLPMIAISSATGTVRKVNIGNSVSQTSVKKDANGNIVGSWDIGLYADLSISIDIGAMDANSRTDLTDAISNFILIYSEKYQNQLFPKYGTGDRWKITLPDTVDIAGESEIPRGDDGIDRIYISNLSFNVLFEDFIQREITPLRMNSYSGSVIPVNNNVKLAEDTKLEFNVGEKYKFQPVVNGSPIDTSLETLLFRLPPTPIGEKDLAVIDNEGNFTALFPGNIQMAVIDLLNGGKSVYELKINKSN